MLELRRPTLSDEETVLDMMAEFEATGSRSDGGFWDKEHFNYEDWLASNADAEMGIGIPDGWVPAIQLVSFVDSRAVGFLHLRLALNANLLEKGGHIGYCIRPSERKKGYAKEQLRQGLELAVQKNLSRVLVTCDSTNQASKRTILACGGVLEDIRQGTERYWLQLSDKIHNERNSV